MCLGIPGQIVEIVNTDLNLAIVDVGGVRRTVNIACVVDNEHPVDSCVGDWVLVHVGFAMNRIDADEVTETLRMLAELAEIEEDAQELVMGDG
jgi:hydrogenase expression/formation protein HypC